MTGQKQDKAYLSICLLFMFGFGFSLANCIWMIRFGLEDIPYSGTILLLVSLVLWIILGTKILNGFDKICNKLECRKKGADK